MTVKSFPADSAISRVEALAAFLAEIDEAMTATVSSIGDLIQNIIVEERIPDAVAEEARSAVDSLEKLNGEEYDFDSFSMKYPRE